MREHLFEIMRCALERVATEAVIVRNLPNKPKGRCIIIGAGKASAEMAAAVEKQWSDVDISGVVATRYGHGAETKKVRVIEAGHPIPDEQSVLAAEAMFEIIKDVTEQDLVLALISGGGSACLASPITGVSLEDLQRITDELLRSGAPINEMNIIRQAFSRIKGGKLGAAIASAELLSLIISDVPGDQLDLVASGPTVLPCQHKSSREALDLLDKHNIHVSEHLKRALSKSQDQQLKPNPNARHIMIASNAEALRAAGNTAERLGYKPIILGDAIEGESAVLGSIMADLTTAVAKFETGFEPPVALISGGETSVTLRGSGDFGKGGRNQEFMLSFANSIQQPKDVWALSIDTDGYDGYDDAAGAVFEPDTVKRAEKLNLSMEDYLERHDSYSFFEQLGDLIKIGATQTNVNDLRVILIR